MGTVTLLQPSTGKTLTLSRILDWRETKRTPIPKKQVFDREAPTTEATSYSDFPLEYVLLCRLTTAERLSLYSIEDEQAMVRLREDGVTIAECWLETTEIDYEIVEHSPACWRVTINLVVMG
jgi:hypothetical protein